MCEQHLDLLPVTTRLQIFGRASDVPDHVACGFMHACDDFSPGLTGTAFLIQRARPAIGLACAIYPGVGFGDAAAFVLEVAPILLQAFAAWARERIGGRVEDEV